MNQIEAVEPSPPIEVERSFDAVPIVVEPITSGTMRPTAGGVLGLATGVGADRGLSEGTRRRVAESVPASTRRVYAGDWSRFTGLTTQLTDTGAWPPNAITTVTRTISRR